jgi:hypothetical protein
MQCLLKFGCFTITVKIEDGKEANDCRNRQTTVANFRFYSVFPQSLNCALFIWKTAACFPLVVQKTGPFFGSI